jgi:hypothetical protein
MLVLSHQRDVLRSDSHQRGTTVIIIITITTITLITTLSLPLGGETLQFPTCRLCWLKDTDTCHFGDAPRMQRLIANICMDAWMDAWMHG